MIIECNYCEAKVDAKKIGQHIERDIDGTYRICLLECPVCKNSLVGIQELSEMKSPVGDAVWSIANRVWPDPKKYVSLTIPDLVRTSLEEAQICFKTKAYNSCVVMCGRAIEGICATFTTKKNNLRDGLKELLTTEIIDKKIFQWAEALRIHRNIGAHASNEKISKDEASDLLDFTDAICNYVFVLSKKFDDFMKRKEKRKPKKP